MTNQEELLYLLDLTMQATLWRINKDSDEQRTPLEIEVMSRIEHLKKGAEPKTVVHPGVFVDKVEEPLNEDDYKALEAARINEHLASPNKVREAKERWKKGRVRVMVNGKPTWKKIEECEKRKCFPDIPESTKWRWCWKGEQQEQQEQVAEVSQPVDKLSDEFWREHEKGEE